MGDGPWVIFVIEEVALRKEVDAHGDVDARNCRVALRSLTNEQEEEDAGDDDAVDGLKVIVGVLAIVTKNSGRGSRVCLHWWGREGGETDRQTDRQKHIYIYTRN